MIPADPVSSRQKVDFVLIVVSIVAALGVLLLIFTPAGTPPPAVEFLSDDYESVEVCPGDVIQYSLEIQINQPSVLFVATSFLRDGQSADTIRGNTVGDLFTTVIPTPRTIVDNDARWEVPNLPPGNYNRAIAAGTFSEPSKPSFREQSFTIREDCE